MNTKPDTPSKRANGAVRFRIAFDGSLHFAGDSPDTEITMDVGTIRSVGLKNLTHFESHPSHRILNSVSHYVKFYGGGELKFSYSSKGKLIEHSACHLIRVTRTVN